MRENLALPYADHLNIKVLLEETGKSHLQLNIESFHLNRHSVLSGGTIYSLSDVGMGLAIYPSLQDDEICATVEIKMSYFNAVKEGKVDCYTRILKKGKRLVFLESEIVKQDKLIAKASGSYLIFKPKAEKTR